MGTNLYKRGSSGNISIRNEFDDLLLGEDTGLPEGTTFLIRQTRLNANGTPEVCTQCRNPITGEVRKDYPCKACNNSGFYFDEVPVYGWKFDRLKSTFKDQPLPPGNISELTYQFYFRYFTIIGRVDTLWEVKHDVNGNVIQPLQRLSKYKIVDANPIRLDNSQIEFISVLARIEDGAGQNKVRLM